MTIRATTAVMLRRVEYGDFDLILTLLTPDAGKIAVIAKAAKKSTKRFPGILEIFSILDVVYERGKKHTGGLPYLKEAGLKRPFMNIRSEIQKTAYASYWAELINLWMEEGQSHPGLYNLFENVLAGLDHGSMPDEVLSLVFQLRFMRIAGMEPNFDSCTVCQRSMGQIDARSLFVSVSKGGMVCNRCSGGVLDKQSLSKGTLMQFRWLIEGDLNRAMRIRLTPMAAQKGLALLERFVPYHLGREPKSLKFLRTIRSP
jgi:DNA repair protein RecO (recombination protein O)